MGVTIAAIMTRKNVVVAKPENNLSQVLDFFTELKIQHLPVCENENELVGIISVNDLLRFIHDKLKEGKAINESVLKNSYTAKDVMTLNPVSLTTANSIDDALEILGGGKFQAVPVCEDGKIVGIVTNKDLVKHLSL